MSTGYECIFIEIKPNQWYYILQNGDCPVGAFDWLDYATAYGPFSTEDVGHKHLERNHANPGGYSSQEYTEGDTLSPSIQRLTDKARI